MLPVRYQNVTLYDCVGYNHSLPGPNRTVTPWCFTSTEGEGRRETFGVMLEWFHIHAQTPM